MTQITEAFRCNSFPSNPKPFATGLFEQLDAGARIDSDECKAVLWVLNAMAFGQLATIDQMHEWSRLNDSL